MRPFDDEMARARARHHNEKGGNVSHGGQLNFYFPYKTNFLSFRCFVDRVLSLASSLCHSFVCLDEWFILFFFCFVYSRLERMAADVA